MDWHTQTTHQCPQCQQMAHLIVTLSEKKPKRDGEHLQYACATCSARFSVNDQDLVIAFHPGQQSGEWHD